MQLKPDAQAKVRMSNVLRSLVSLGCVHFFLPLVLAAC